MEPIFNSEKSVKKLGEMDDPIEIKQSIIDLLEFHCDNYMKKRTNELKTKKIIAQYVNLWEGDSIGLAFGDFTHRIQITNLFVDLEILSAWKEERFSLHIETLKDIKKEYILREDTNIAGTPRDKDNGGNGQEEGTTHSQEKSSDIERDFRSLSIYLKIMQNLRQVYEKSKKCHTAKVQALLNDHKNFISNQAKDHDDLETDLSSALEYFQVQCARKRINKVQFQSLFVGYIKDTFSKFKDSAQMVLIKCYDALPIPRLIKYNHSRAYQKQIVGPQKSPSKQDHDKVSMDVNQTRKPASAKKSIGNENVTEASEVPKDPTSFEKTFDNGLEKKKENKSQEHILQAQSEEREGTLVDQNTQPNIPILATQEITDSNILKPPHPLSADNRKTKVYKKRLQDANKKLQAIERPEKDPLESALYIANEAAQIKVNKLSVPSIGKGTEKNQDETQANEKDVKNISMNHDNEKQEKKNQEDEDKTTCKDPKRNQLTFDSDEELESVISKTSTPSKKMQGKKRKRWTMEEDDALRNGITKYGISSWAEIKAGYPLELRDRTNVNIKDRYRTLVNRNEI